MTATDDALKSFTIVSRDESWMSGTIIESRLMHGTAHRRGNSIEAVDTCDERLLQMCQAALDVARSAVSELRTKVRMRVRATREDGADHVETTIIIGAQGLSVVTTPSHAHRDFEFLMGLAGSKPVQSVAPLPIVWQNGSAAILFHEAIGHANEHCASEVPWPSWLSVDAPIAFRRETFRDVPLPRMRQLIARQSEAPFAAPHDRIDVQLIAGGGYDPVTDVVTINVAVSTAGPFTIRRTRAQIASSLVGAAGEPVRYPGVICSREGQALYVASHAPLLVTGPLT